MDMRRRAFLRFLAIAPALLLPADSERARDESVAPGDPVAPEPSWASEWPPTAGAGKLALLPEGKRVPCSTCGGRHPHYTLKGECLPILWCGDWDCRIGDATLVDPPDGVHVREIHMRADGPGRYAVVRRGESGGGRMG